MAGQNTTYKVDIVYDLKGSAAKGLRGINQDAKQATQSMGGLRSMLALAGGGALFAGGKKFLVDYNNEITKMKIGLATVTSMNLHVPFEMGKKAADKLFETFQKMAVSSPSTTKDFVEMANMISGGVLQAGLGLKELESITKGAVTASNALGAKPEMLALDVTQMLAGTVAIRDRYARQLLAGIGETDYKKFNQYDAGKRARLVQKSFDQPSLKSAADEFGGTFEGVTSTLKDNLEIALGKVGLPLLKELTNEVKGWNAWIEKNPEKIASMVSTLGNGLKDAFSIVKDIASGIFPIVKDVMGVIKDVLGFVAEHKDLLLNVVKGMLVFKGAKMAGGLISGAGGMAKNLFGGLDKSMTGIGDAASNAEGGILSMAGGIAKSLPGLFKFAGVMAGFATLPIALGGNQAQRDADAAKKAAEIKTATDMTDAQAKIDSFNARLKNIGVDPNDKTMDIGGLKAERDTTAAGLKQAQDKVIGQAIAEGMVKEELNAAGTRRLTFTGPGSSSTKELADAVTTIFKLKAREAYEEAKAGGFMMPRTADFSGVNGARGFYEEYVGAAKSEADPYGLHATPPKVEVNINKIEVYSDDPDRFVAQAVQSFEEVTRNPTQAHEIMRGAF